MEALNPDPKGSRVAFQGTLTSPFLRHHIPCGMAQDQSSLAPELSAAREGENGAETLNKAKQSPRAGRAAMAQQLLHCAAVTAPLQPSIIAKRRLFYFIFIQVSFVSHRAAFSCSQGNLLCLTSALQVNKYHTVISSTCWLQQMSKGNNIVAETECWKGKQQGPITSEMVLHPSSKFFKVYFISMAVVMKSSDSVSLFNPWK